MTATILIRHLTGDAGGPTYTDVTSANTRFNTSDTHAASGSETPIPIPSAGANYSYWVVYQADCAGSPDGTVDNLRWYTSGSSTSPAGVSWLASDASTYVQAVGTEGVTGLVLNATNYPTLSGSTEDPFTWTAGSPKSVSGSISNPSTGPFGDFLAVQIQVDSTTALAGPIDAETLSLVFDES